MMGQMQDIIDFPPAPKLDPVGRLDPNKATPQELAGEQVFMGKGQCAMCHIPQTAFMDNNMHDLKLERFYKVGQTVNGLVDTAGWPNQDLHVAGHQGLTPLSA